MRVLTIVMFSFGLAAAAAAEEAIIGDREFTTNGPFCGT